MRVGLVSDFFPPTVMGGAEISSRLLAEALSGEGLEVHLLTPSFSGSRRPEKIDGFTTYYYLFPFKSGIRRHAILGNPFFYLWSYRAISQYAEHAGLNLLHAQNKYSIPGSALAARQGHIPVLATVRDTLPLCEFAVCTLKGETRLGVDCGLLKLLKCTREFQELYDLESSTLSKTLRWLPLAAYARINSGSLRYFLKRVDQIVAVSNGLKDVYVKSGFEAAKIAVIPNIIPTLDRPKAEDLAKLEALRRRLNLKSGDRVVLYVGRLSWGKGVHLLVEAMGRVFAKVRNVKLIVAGAGILEPVLKKMVASQRSADSILFLGSVDHEVVLRLYGLADLVASPSIWPEPLSRVHLEAMAAGKPIIASRIGGNLETVIDGKTGLLVAPRDVDALAESIVYLLENPKAASELGKRGMKEAKRHFSPSGTARKMIALYESMLGEA